MSKGTGGRGEKGVRDKGEGGGLTDHKESLHSRKTKPASTGQSTREMLRHLPQSFSHLLKYHNHHWIYEFM
jgi:hypothetical protein